MKAVCRRCRATGPGSASVRESHESVEALGWKHTKRGGFACPDCQGKPPTPVMKAERYWMAMKVVLTFMVIGILAQAVLQIGITAGWWGQ